MSFIIDKLLAKKPEHRFQTAEALGVALAREIAAQGEQAPVRRGLPLRLKLLLLMASVTAFALAGSVFTVLDRQEHTLQRIAVAAGTSISDFVTRNSAVMFADNAGLAPEEQDWTTLQAYVASASKDPEISSMVVVDNTGTVRAASDSRLIGKAYSVPLGETTMAGVANGSGSDAAAPRVTLVPERGKGGGLRFVRPVHYAGADFGSVDIVMKRGALDAAIADTRDMLVLLSLIVIGVVAAIGYLSGAMVTRPLTRLTKALREAPDCGFALRISHRRRDEFAAAFDSFNTAATVIDQRLSESAPAADADLALTRIAPPTRQVA